MKKFLSTVLALCLVFVMSFSFTAAAADDKIVWDNWDIEDGIVHGYSGTDTVVTIPNMDQYGVKIKEVNSNALAGKSGITKIVVANGITTLHGACFKEMPDLTEVVFPSSLINLGYGSNLVNSPKLEKITLPGSLVRVSDGFAALSPKLKEVVFSYGIKTVGYQSFLQTGLTEVILPESVEQIESRAFAELLSDEFTITICNPDVKLGGGEEKEPMKAQGIFAQNPNVKITIICPEGSAAAKYFADNLPNAQSKVETKPQSYFDELPENQSDYGQQEVAPVYAPEGMEDVVHDGTQKLEEDPAVSFSGTASGNETGNNNTDNNNNNNNNNSTVTVGSSIDWKPIITVVIIVFAAVILILIIVVVIVVVVRAQKKKKRRAAREARKAAEAAALAAPEEEVAEPVEAPVDEPETQE